MSRILHSHHQNYLVEVNAVKYYLGCIRLAGTYELKRLHTNSFRTIFLVNGYSEVEFEFVEEDDINIIE